MEFLDDLEQRYELVIYTAGDQRYAERILDFIELKKKYFAHRLFKEQCLEKEGECLLKHLGVLCGNRKLEELVFVDNSIRNFTFSIRNGLPVKDFKGEENDMELIYLAKYLRELAKAPDVRVPLKNDFVAFLSSHFLVK